MSAPEPVLVVGGGLIGLFCANHLLGGGHRVTVLDAGDFGGGAARVNAGWLCPGISDPLPSAAVVRDGMTSLVYPSSGAFRLMPQAIPRVVGYLARFVAHAGPGSHRRGWDALDELNRRTHPLSQELVASGVLTDLADDSFLVLHEHRARAEHAHRSATETASRGLVHQPGPLLERDELLALEPGLGEAARFGFLQRGDLWLDPSKLVDALLARLRSHGVELLAHHRVTAIEQRGERVHVTTQAGDLDAPQAVLCAGAWSEPLLRRLGIRSDLVSGHGYSFMVRPEHLPQHALRLGDSHVAATPMGERLRLAGVVEVNASPDEPDMRRLEQVRRAAEPWLAGVDWDDITDPKSGPRPMTPDGLPLIGRVPGHERIVVATGHNMLGLSLGPATGELVARIVDGGRAPRAFDPARGPAVPRLRRR